MKLRKHRKVIQARTKHNKAYQWYIERIITAVVKASTKMSKALELVYMDVVKKGEQK